MHLMMPLLESFGMTDIGLARANNEDAWRELPDIRFYIIADGIGGKSGGEIAAREAVLQFCDFLEKFFRQTPEPTTEAAKVCLKNAFQETNRWILKFAAEYPSLRGMGTTLSCLLVLNYQLIYAHVGDSRIYRFHNKLERLTKDHSLKEEIECTSKGALYYNYKNVLTRALGISSKVEPEIQDAPFQTGEHYVLCSDGLYSSLSDTEMEQILSQPHSLKEKTIRLVEAAKNAGGRDNITIVMIKAIDL